MLKYLANKIAKPVLSFYLRKERGYSYHGLSLRIFPGVFHPAFFFSTTCLYTFITRLSLDHKTCLDIGCGSGLLSLQMARQGGLVTAIDISEQAVKNTQLNFNRNRQQLHRPYTVLLSDLFDRVPVQAFDVIVINPPYFFGPVTQESQYAWYCGQEGEYFEKLFSGLRMYMHPTSHVSMILADNCDVERIRAIAGLYHFYFQLAEQKKIAWETNYIFSISAQR